MKTADARDERGKRAETRGGNLLSYDRAVRNDREVIGKIWFSDYRLAEDIEQAAGICSWNIAATLNPALWRLFRFARFVDRFIADKTISARHTEKPR